MVVRGAAELARSVVARVNDEEDAVGGGAVAWCRFQRRVRVVAADASRTLRCRGWLRVGGGEKQDGGAVLMVVAGTRGGGENGGALLVVVLLMVAELVLWWPPR